MRLVELQRAALGITTPPRHWESRVQAEGSTVEAEVVEPSASAVIAADLTATPAASVIAGAVVTLTLSLANEGVLPAHDLVVCIPIPGDASYRSGSLVRDGRAEDDRFAETLFGDGLRIANLPAGSRATFVWKISVRSGMQPLTVTPTIHAGDAAIVGGRALVISRQAPGHTAFSAAVAQAEIPQTLQDDLPFYELDTEEELEHIAGEAAIAEITPAQPASVEPQPEPEPEPEPQLPAEEPPQREGIVLVGTFDRPSLAYFERIFTATKPPTLLNHFIFGGALACNRSYVSGNEVGGLKRHMDAQSQILHRITLHEKLGRKEPIAEYTGALGFDNASFVSEPIPPRGALASSPERLILETEIDAPSLAQIQKLSEDPQRWDFIAARQVTLLLQGRRVVDETQPDLAADVSKALAAYADAARVHLNRLFVRIRLDRTTGALYHTEESLDTAARAALVAMRRLFDALG